MNKMNKNGESLLHQLIETAGTVGESLGLNRTVCQMYALLYFSSKPMTPSDITKALGISKANVSVNLRKLEEWNAVTRVWRKGYARSLYQANEDLGRIVAEKLQAGITKRLRLMRQAISQARQHQSLEENSHESVNFSAKVRNLREFLDKIEYFLRVITELNKR
ncbi:MAG: MarR family transcriptional regulator [Candidatus Omnitrophica bacterium]|nr:MarR family transcriptional regulator [Candidatus Omnitrophota bacterium]